MKSLKHGKNISLPEVTNISEHGFWLLLADKEYFLPFEQFPWFRTATIDQITKVTLESPSHIYWPDLDIDLSTTIIEHPEKYQLVSK
ncbi:MAG TPA: DUF2442 domain-containing protein [Methylococcales bacterium]